MVAFCLARCSDGRREGRAGHISVTLLEDIHKNGRRELKTTGPQLLYVVWNSGRGWSSQCESTSSAHRPTTRGAFMFQVFQVLNLLGRMTGNPNETMCRLDDGTVTIAFAVARLYQRNR